MTPLQEIMALGLVSPVLLYVAHMPTARIFRRQPHNVLILLTVLIQIPVLLAGRHFLQKQGFSGCEMLLGLTYLLLVSLSLGYVYFLVFCMGETARRIRLLHEIRDSGSLPESKIFSSYSGDEILEVRLKRLLDGGQLAFDGQRYRLKGRGLFYWGAVTIITWGKILGFKQS